MADPRRCTHLSDLPMDVLSSIADRGRSFADCVRFDSVIRRFSDGGSSSSRKLQKLRNFPWLVIEVDDATKIPCFFSGRHFFPIRRHASTTRNVTCCYGSFFGWLFMAFLGTGSKRYITNYLLNPCTNQRIQLPCLSMGACDGKVVMSDEDGGLLVMTSHCNYFAYCRLGDEEWSVRNFLHPPTRSCAEDIIFFKGLLYVVDGLCKIMTIDFRNLQDGGICHRVLPVKRHPKSWVIHGGQCIQFFWVESDGELLLLVKEVKLCCRNAAKHGDDCLCYAEAIHFGVFMLDLSGPSWVELTTLGNRMVLVDLSSSLSLDALKFTQFRFRPNCIYYTNYGERDDYGWHEFCLEDKKIVPFVCNFSTLFPLLPYY